MAARRSGTALAYPRESRVANPSSRVPVAVARAGGCEDRARYGGHVDLAGQAPRPTRKRSGGPPVSAPKTCRRARA